MFRDLARHMFRGEMFQWDDESQAAVAGRIEPVRGGQAVSLSCAARHTFDGGSVGCPVRRELDHDELHS